MQFKWSREEILDRLLKSYQSYFDIERVEASENGLPLYATCCFHVHSEKYVLVKKAKLWDADSNEYVYIFQMPMLTEELFELCKQYAYEEGMKKIDPKPGHMYSYITSVFVCDNCSEKAERLLSGCKIYKSFHFSWYGWMNFHTAAVIRETGKILTNRSGRSNAKFLKKILNS